MPVKSRAQAGFMAMSRTRSGRNKLLAHGKRPAPVSTANEFMKASRGMKFSRLPAHVRKK